MKRITLLISLLAIITFKGYSQRDFRKGFVINTNYDTTWGYIDYRGSIFNSTKCIFKQGPDSSSKVYYPSDIKAYGIKNGKFYVAQSIGDSINKNIVFLELLFDGIVDIYFYKNSDKEAYYVQKEKGNLIELTNKTYEEPSSSLSSDAYRWNNKRYIGILRYIFSDSQPTLNKVDHVSLDHKSLIDIARCYHTDVCKDSYNAQFEKTEHVPKIKYGIKVGYKVTVINFKHTNYDFKFDTESNVLFGIELDLSVSKTNEKLSFLIESLYSKTKLSSSYIENTYVGPEYNYADINYSSFLSAISLKYTYPKGKLQPTLYVGGILDYMIANKSKIIIENQSNQRILESDEILFYPNRSAQGGFKLGLGIDYNIVNKMYSYMRFDYNYLFLNRAISSIENYILTFGIKI